MNKLKFATIIAILFSLSLFTVVFGQSEELSLGLSRDFGYRGFNNDISGIFSIKASGPINLVRVQFFMDGVLLGEDTESPFVIRFLTKNYPVGIHTINAIGTIEDGEQITSHTIRANFVSKEGVVVGTLKLIAPILIVLFGATAIRSLSIVINQRKRQKILADARHSYWFGGGICPNCKRPFAFQFFSINLIGKKLTPCPNCGKWSIVKRASIYDLRAAELAEKENEAKQSPEGSVADKLHDALHDSRYQNL